MWEGYGDRSILQPIPNMIMTPELWWSLTCQRMGEEPRHYRTCLEHENILTTFRNVSRWANLQCGLFMAISPDPSRQSAVVASARCTTICSRHGQLLPARARSVTEGGIA